MSLFDKAKEATGAAAEKASALKDQATVAAGDLREHAALKATEVLEAGFGQIKSTVADFNATLPIVNLAGYSLAGVTLELGLSPKVVATFHVIEEITDEKTDALLQKHADNKMASMLVRTLHRAAKLQASISIGGLRPKSLTVAIGLPPSVAISFG